MPARRPLGMRALAWIVAAAAAVFVLARLLEPAPPPARTVRQSGYGAPNYAAAIGRIDATLAGLKQLAAARPDDWIVQERIATQAMQRARLSGSFNDYAEAQHALDRAFANATPGAGPHLTQAVLAVGLHRLGRAEQMLAAVDGYAVPDDRNAEAAAALRGDIAFYRGSYPQALAAYRALARAGMPADYRLAAFWSRMGRPDAALAALDRAGEATMLAPQVVANLAMLRGVIALQRGIGMRRTRISQRPTAPFPALG